MRRGLVLVLIALLVGSVVPFALASGSGNTTGTEEILQERVVAQKLMDNLKRLAEFVNRVVPENMTNSTYLFLAEEHYNRALSEFQAGNYNASMVDALMAMHYYRLLIARLGLRFPSSGGENIKLQAERLRDYLQYASRLIKRAEAEGLNVTNASRLYNETVEAFKLVIGDIHSGNLTKAREDYRVAVQRKAELDSALRELRIQMLYKNSKTIVNRFLQWGESAIKAANGTVSSEFRGVYQNFVALYSNVKELAEQGEWKEALNELIKNRRTIREFQLVLRGSYLDRGGFTVNAKSIRELHERIVKDRKALVELKNRGVDVSGAWVLLNVATDDFKLGLRCLWEGRSEEAKVHFLESALLVKRVDEFIKTHS